MQTTRNIKSSAPPLDADSLSIGTATFSELEELTAIHCDAFPGFFLTMLGRRFLSELYRGFLTHRTGIALVARHNGAVVGFAVGTSDGRSFFRYLLYLRGFRFLFAALRAVRQNPIHFIARLSQAVSYRGDSSKNMLGRGALLSSFAVKSEFNRCGIGKSLMQAFLEAAGQRGVDYVCLTTDQDNNDTAIGFYQRVGFLIDGVFIRRNGRRMIRLIKPIRQHESQSHQDVLT